MKYMFVSDIHGNIDKFDTVIEIFKNEEADKIVFLGDTASSYDEQDNYYIVKGLNEMKEKVIMIRGNCDTYDFEKSLQFPIFDVDNLYVNKKTITITHGHRYNYWNVPDNCGEIFIQGHTHIPVLEKRNDIIFANPGSVSRPKGADLRCYIILDEKKIALKALNGVIIKGLLFKINAL